MPGFWQRLLGSGKSGESDAAASKSFLQSLSSIFGGSKGNGEKPVLEDIQTKPLSEAQLVGIESVQTRFLPLQVGVGVGQSAGKIRDHNEDTLFIFNSLLADGKDDLVFGLFIVADGMGGHQHGEVASGTAARVMADVILNRLFSPMLTKSSENRNEPIHELMESAVREAQYAVTRQAPGGGTTLTTAMLIGDKVIIVQIGDSRAYFMYPDGRCQVVTQDHSLVRRLVELGQLTEEEAAVHPQRNVLYRALGQAEPFKPDINTHQVPRPGYILLCSDGLWGLIPEGEIFRIVTSAATPSAAAHELVETANRNGGTDNITAIVLQFYA